MERRKRALIMASGRVLFAFLAHFRLSTCEGGRGRYRKRGSGNHRAEKATEKAKSALSLLFRFASFENGCICRRDSIVPQFACFGHGCSSFIKCWPGTISRETGGAGNKGRWQLFLEDTGLGLNTQRSSLLWQQLNQIYCLHPMPCSFHSTS